MQPPSRERQLAWLVTDNAGPLLAAIGTALVLAYYLLAWTRVGRDPAGGTIVPLFAPPDGISPPAARYATAMRFDHRAFAAGILSLAVKGRLRIEDTDGGYRLVQCPASTPALTEAESRLHGSLFRQGSSLDLVRSNRTRIQAARKSLRQALEHELGGPVFRTNRGWLIGGIVLSALVLIGVLLLLQREVAQDQLAGFGLSAGCAAGFVLFLVLQSARRWWEERSFGSFFRLLAFSALLALLAGLGFLLLTWAGSWRLLAAAVAAPLLVGLGFTFYHLLKAPTPAGRRRLDQLRGFRHYLEVAEEHRLGILHPPERTPELFERYLPFALALGVEHAWSQKFAGALGRRAAERDTGPSWYRGDR